MVVRFDPQDAVSVPNDCQYQKVAVLPNTKSLVKLLMGARNGKNHFMLTRL